MQIGRRLHIGPYKSYGELSTQVVHATAELQKKKNPV